MSMSKASLSLLGGGGLGRKKAVDPELRTNPLTDPTFHTIGLKKCFQRTRFVPYKPLRGSPDALGSPTD